MSTIQSKTFKHSILNSTETSKTASKLQACLVTLVDLSLAFKQLHWNVVGAHFRPVHLQLDEIIDTVREASDEVAERISTLGVSPDGRANTVAQNSALGDMPTTFVDANTVLEIAADSLKQTIAQIREALETVGDQDAMSEDLLVGICRDLEKHLWMVQAQLAHGE